MTVTRSMWKNVRHSDFLTFCACYSEKGRHKRIKFHLVQKIRAITNSRRCSTSDNYTGATGRTCIAV